MQIAVMVILIVCGVFLCVALLCGIIYFFNENEYMISFELVAMGLLLIAATIIVASEDNKEQYTVHSSCGTTTINYVWAECLMQTDEAATLIDENGEPWVYEISAPIDDNGCYLIWYDDDGDIIKMWEEVH